MYKRQEHCGGNAICSRFGGDEFVAAEVCQGSAKEKMCIRDRLCVEDSVEIVVQVNGKVKARFNAPVDCAKEELENLAFDLPEIKALTDGKTVVKKIAVPNKLVNIVVK